MKTALSEADENRSIGCSDDGVLAVFALYGHGWAQAPKPSQHGTVSQQIANTTITVTYNRPVARGREIFGKLVPWGQRVVPWRRHAARRSSCRPTSRSTARPSRRGRTPSGSSRKADRWTIIFNRANPVFHTRHPPDQDVLRVQAKPREGAHMETLAFYFPVVDGKHAELVLHWGTVVVPLTIDVP